MCTSVSVELDGLYKSICYIYVATSSDYWSQLQNEGRICIQVHAAFLPYRNNLDLLQDRSYQLKFVTEEKNRKFSAEMLEIVDNIQMVYNSLEASIPENTLTAEIDQREAEDFWKTRRMTKSTKMPWQT